jgi:isocitrate lyase
MAGKVLVPISEHINRLIAIRLQYDIMGVENLAVARTDAEAATLLSSNVDERDHPFILGSTNESLEDDLVTVMNKAERSGVSGDDLQKVEDDWSQAANLMLYSDCVAAAAKKAGVSQAKIDEFNKATAHVPHGKAVRLAKSMLNLSVHWDWNAPRTREGFYRYQGGTQCAINRAVAFAPYCDLLWMETKSPILAQAKEFAAGVRAAHPNKWLAYNLSPSFNWSAAGLDESQMKDYIWELGKLGFVWQFITVSFVPSFGFYLLFPPLTSLHFVRLARRSPLERLHQ